MKYSFHPAAVAEFNKAIDYYELAEPGLGFDFAMKFIPPFGVLSPFQGHGRLSMEISGVLWFVAFPSVSCIHLKTRASTSLR